jgi:hypothetical protein
MIDDKTKIKLLKELEKTGNIYVACLKVGIGRTTYYRWLADDTGFKTRANKALKYGRANMTDISEHSLVMLIKDKDFPAIKYWLSHNSKIYKPKTTSKVILEHTRKVIGDEPPQQGSLEEWLDILEARDDERERKEQEKNQIITPLQPIIKMPDSGAAPISDTPLTPVEPETLGKPKETSETNNQVKKSRPKRDRRFGDPWE